MFQKLQRFLFALLSIVAQLPSVTPSLIVRTSYQNQNITIMSAVFNNQYISILAEDLSSATTKYIYYVDMDTMTESFKRDVDSTATKIICSPEPDSSDVYYYMAIGQVGSTTTQIVVIQKNDLS